VIVCTLTGHGLKDTNAVLNDRVKPVSAPADKSAILSILEKFK
jgi:threonine synthase